MVKIRLYFGMLAFGMLIIGCDNNTTSGVELPPNLQIHGVDIPGMPDGLPPGSQRGNPGGLNGVWVEENTGTSQRIYYLFNDGNMLMFNGTGFPDNPVLIQGNRWTYSISDGVVTILQRTHRYIRLENPAVVMVGGEVIPFDWGRGGWFDRDQALTAFVGNGLSEQDIINSNINSLFSVPGPIIFSISGDVLMWGTLELIRQ